MDRTRRQEIALLGPRSDTPGTTLRHRTGRLLDRIDPILDGDREAVLLLRLVGRRGALSEKQKNGRRQIGDSGLFDLSIVGIIEEHPVSTVSRENCNPNRNLSRDGFFC
jgi:hypothetical protein